MTEDKFGFHEDGEEISEEELTEEGFTDDNWGDDSDWGFAAGKMFVKAIRSSGYKNAAMALGE